MIFWTNQISHMKLRTKFLIAAIYLFCSLMAGVTGKISGRITDKVSGEPLIGANVLLQGTSTGAATDIEGYYHIINVVVLCIVQPTLSHLLLFDVL